MRHAQDTAAEFSCDKPPAMAVDLYDILAGKGLRCAKNTDKHLINQLVMLLIINIAIADRMAFFFCTSIFKMLSAIDKASAPLIRMMEIAPSTAAVEIAAIVSFNIKTPAIYYVIVSQKDEKKGYLLNNPFVLLITVHAVCRGFPIPAARGIVNTAFQPIHQEQEYCVAGGSQRQYCIIICRWQMKVSGTEIGEQIHTGYDCHEPACKAGKTCRKLHETSSFDLYRTSAEWDEQQKLFNTYNDSIHHLTPI